MWNHQSLQEKKKIASWFCLEVRELKNFLIYLHKRKKPLILLSWLLLSFHDQRRPRPKRAARFNFIQRIC